MEYVCGLRVPLNTGTSLHFTAASTDIEPSDELNYSAGFDIAPHDRVTLSADFVVRSLRNNGQVRVDDGFPTLSARTRLPLLVGVAGMKINLASQWLLTASVLVPLSSDGLKPGPTPIVGIERAF